MNHTPTIQERAHEADMTHETEAGRYQCALPRPLLRYLPLAAHAAEGLAEQCILIAARLAVGELVAAMMELDIHLARLHEFIDFVVMSANGAQASRPAAAAVLHRYARDVLAIVDRISDCLEQRDLDRVGFAIKRGLATALRRYRCVVAEIGELSEYCRVTSSAADAGHSFMDFVPAAAG